MRTNCNIKRRLPLAFLSVLYLALPCYIFFLGYLHWIWAVFFSLCLSVGVWRSARAYEAVHVRISWQNLFILGLAALALLLISGVGGYGYQTDDWLKHNAILSDLIQSPWPLVYDMSLQGSAQQSTAVLRIPLVYYVAYYLPAALVGKMAGWFWANQTLLLWTWGGLTLSLAWLRVLLQRSFSLTVLVFLLFSGLDSVGLILIRRLLGQEIGFSSWEHIDIWAGNWVYSSNISLLFWVPNQAISGWILTGLMCSPFFLSNSLKITRRHAGFYLSLSALWAPFVTVGLLPAILSSVWIQKKGRLWGTLKEYVSVANICGMFLLMLMAAFYASRLVPLPLSLPPIKQGLIFGVPQVSGLFWYETLALLLLFWFLEVGLYGAFVRSAASYTLCPDARRLWIISMSFLLFLLFFRYGQWNDLVMRASIPSLFILAIVVIRTLHTFRNTFVTALLILVLMLGAITPAFELKRHLQHIAATGALFHLPDASPLPSISRAKNPSFFLQYIGSADTAFFHWFAKPIPRQLAAEESP